MPLDEHSTSVGHPCTPHSTDPDFTDLVLISEQVQRNPPVDRPGKVQEIVHDNRDGNDDGLRHLRTVNPSKDVDTVRGKSGQERHVKIIKRA